MKEERYNRFVNATVSEAPPPPTDTGSGFARRFVSFPYRRFAPERVVGTMTVDEWDVFVREAKHKYHYVYGKVVQMAGASYEHNQLQANFGRALGNIFESDNIACQAIGSDMRVFVRRGLYYFPDIVVVCGNAQVDEREALRNPAAVIEVLSPTTENDDRTDKFREYQSIESLRHYVLVDQSRVAVTHFEKLPDGLWAIRADFRDRHDTLALTFGDTIAAVPLSHIYRGVALPDLEEVAAF